ncbi:MAG: glycosyltransferase family 39 protein [Anaerolineae bacterium]
MSLALILIILFAFALRLFKLGAESIWYDESVSLYLAKEPLDRLIFHTAHDIHPPGYYILLHFWLLLAGDSEFSAAFFSLFFGLLLLPVGYWLGRFLYGSRVGMVAAGLVAISPFNLWYSQEIRMYTLGAFLALVGLYCLVRLLGNGGWKLEVGGWILSSVWGLYTLYYFVFLLAAENLYVLYHIWRKRDWAFLWRWVPAQTAIIVLYLPWLPIALRQAANPPVPPWRAFVPLQKILSESWAALLVGQSVEGWQAYVAMFTLGLIYICGLAWRGKGYRLLLASYTFGPVALIYIASFWNPLFHVRYVFTYSGAFCILMAAGLVWLARRARLMAILAGAGILISSTYSMFNYYFNERYLSDDYRAAVDYLAGRYRPGDAVLINAGYVYTAFLYYYREPIAWRGRLVDYQGQLESGEGPVLLQSGSIGGSPNLGWGDPQADFYATTKEETARALERAFARHPRLWVLRAYDTVVDPQGFIRAWLEGHGLKFDDQLFRGESSIRVQGYLTYKEPPRRLPPSARPIRGAFEDAHGRALALAGLEPVPEKALAGGNLDFVLYWRAERLLGLGYRVLYGLFDEEGKLLAQGGEIPLGPLYPPWRWPAGPILRHPARLTIPPDTPQGDYTLKVGVYNDREGQALRATGPEAGAIEETPWLTVGVVHIEGP